LPALIHAGRRAVAAPADQRVRPGRKPRGYEAALIAAASGRDARYMDGGIAMWPYEKTT
jgi:hypothetical protein